MSIKPTNQPNKQTNKQTNKVQILNEAVGVSIHIDILKKGTSPYYTALQL